MPGPPKTPTKILSARGSWRANTRNAEPDLPTEIPLCPMWLNREAKAEWRRVVPRLANGGILTRVDRGILATYCQSWADLYRATKMVEQQGEVIKDSRGENIKNQWVAVKAEAWIRYFRSAAVLGLTPSSRAGLHVEPKRAQSGKDRFFRSG